jgi:3'(2'), 5'-bisphosphate nucleotidase
MGFGDHLLVNRISVLHPGDVVLSEEGADSPMRTEAERVWIIDPLDGTREFGEPPRNDWAVHVALVVACTPVAGAVGYPAAALSSAQWSRRSRPPFPASRPGSS